MTPELIEAAAKLCGWELRKSHWFLDGLKMAYVGWPGEEPQFHSRGLLALEDALLRRGWWHIMLLDLSWHRWVHGKFEYKQAEDRATAACLAAQAELEEK